MATSAIHLSVQAGSNSPGGELLNPVSTATIEFFGSFAQTPGNSSVVLNAMNGVSLKCSAGVGDFQLTSQACVSDSSLVAVELNHSDLNTALLANEGFAIMSDNMGDSTSLQALNQDLLNALPQIKQALNGGMGATELSQLIADLQAQMLELNTLSQHVFGDASLETDLAVTDISLMDDEELLSSMQIDCNLFAQPEPTSGSTVLAFEATLDGLFTSPEAFPLTLDFSNPNSIQEASELFALTGSSAGISSNASDSTVTELNSSPMPPDFS